MEFQQGITLIVAFIGTISGAGAFYGMTRTELAALRREHDEMKNNVVWKDTCKQCKENSQNQILGIKDNMERIDNKLDLILERLTSRGQ